MRGIRLVVLAALVSGVASVGCSAPCKGTLSCPCLDGLCHTSTCDDNCGNVCETFQGQQVLDGGGASFCAKPDGG